ncbi:MAG: hypothetical protein DMG45_19640, partial [Acidobacteria bacterium]
SPKMLMLVTKRKTLIGVCFARLSLLVDGTMSLVDKSESAQRKLKLGFAGSRVMWARCIFRPFKRTLSLGPEAEADIPVYS